MGMENTFILLSSNKDLAPMSTEDSNKKDENNLLVNKIGNDFYYLLQGFIIISNYFYYLLHDFIIIGNCFYYLLKGFSLYF